MILNSKILGESSKSIIVLHGLFGSLDNWFSIGNELSNNFQVHLLDLTNHGKSYHSNEHSYELMSEDLKNYINYYNLNKPSIIGHSMGGKVAMFFSFKYNYLIDNLVIVDIAPKKYKNEHAEIISALTEVSSIQLNSRKEAEQILNNFSIPKNTIQFLLKNLYWTENENLIFRFNLNVIKNSINELLDFPLDFKTMNNKTFFIRGSDSNYINDNDLIIIKEKFPNSILIDIFEAGHWVHFDQRKKFIETIKKILL